MENELTIEQKINLLSFRDKQDLTGMLNETFEIDKPWPYYCHIYLGLSKPEGKISAHDYNYVMDSHLSYIMERIAENSVLN
jgi:hypothetical protein